MDWNGDGKHDWKDDAIFHNVIETDKTSSDKEPNVSSGSSSAGSASLGISSLGTVVIVLVIILCMAALFMGYANIIGDLLCLGVIAFLIAQRLDS